MFTYGYIREATMAHIDLDEEEVQAMNLLGRFHIFANEAMQAICSDKPMYKYLEVTIVPKYAPLVYDVDTNGEAFIREATKREIEWDPEEDGELEVKFLNEVQVKDYWNKKGIYQVCDKVKMDQAFIAFTDRQAYKIVEEQVSLDKILEAEAFDIPLIKKTQRVKTVLDHDFSYISKNQIKFYKPGTYEIPYKSLWYIFESGIGDDVEIDMPSDILLTIPLYIASVCMQIDNPQKANIKRSEFELALAKCTSSDFMTLNEIKSTW